MKLIPVLSFMKTINYGLVGADHNPVTQSLKVCIFKPETLSGWHSCQSGSQADP